MNLSSRITLAVSNFIKKHWPKFIVIFFVWLAIFIINQYLKNTPEEIASTNTYNPDKAVMDENGNVPSRYRNEIKDTLESYFNYCKSQDYEKAYNLLTKDCKDFLYDNNVSRFVEYVSDKIDNTKTYYIQNYSNLNQIFIYDLHIMDNIEITGGTNGIEERKEKIALMQEENQFKISNQGYIKKETLNSNAEDQNIKVKVMSKDISYQKESYNVNITNKTDKYILISDGSYTDSVTLNLGDQKRNATNTPNTTFLVAPNSNKDFSFIFDKFADDGKKPTEINFNNVRIYDIYNTKLTPEDSEKLYSFNISLK